MSNKAVLGALVAIGLALPSLAHAATERWALSQGPGSDGDASGYIDYDRSSSTVMGGTASISDVAKVYFFKGNVAFGYLILEANSPAFINQHLYLLNPLPLATSSTGSVVLTGFTAQCTRVDGQYCVEFGALYPADGVTATLQAPATPTPVPTMTEWAMILMGAALAGSAALTLYRRRPRAA